MEKIKLSLFKAFVATALFFLIYKYPHIEITKKLTEDKAFDYMAKYYIADDSVKTDSPHVMVFGIDNFYFKSENLLDEENKTNYGFLFPHDKIAEFIEKIDAIPKENTPKALFIDYDFEFTSSVYGKRLSEENIVLMNKLKELEGLLLLSLKRERAVF